MQVSATRPFYELGRLIPPTLGPLPTLAWLRSAQHTLPHTLVADWGADVELQSFWVRDTMLNI